MPRGRGIRWAFQSLTQGSAKGGFQAGRHAHLIKNGLGRGRATRFQNFCQCCHFGGDACARSADFGGLTAGLHQGFGCCCACCFRFTKPRRAADQGRFRKARGRKRRITRSFRNTLSQRGIAFDGQGRILRDNAPMAVISSLQRGFAARGFGTGFLGTAARFGMGGNGFCATRFCLFQSLTRGGEGCFRLGHLLRGGLLFRIRNRPRKGSFLIHT